ncbi:hypothetical protein L202_07862 [Cryptococcus amylolentus CBS 6039]|uniref:Exocyst complex component EXO84 n=1 Tax=Cryptococcus amylolentus CBS 6039 TaxID=1295533 RepID=A0A1E3HC21_9TREE|nr:hypothetical protein L202_07862 [Cryptococcus amylolentus CBS 6039]ODN73316.1 hypothetical protein L202_07862 [Cryptococcus amylolentus CBS 6039]
MASLRRPSAAPPRGSNTGPIQSGPRPPLPNGNQKQKRKSKVGDKIKKRLSMRYTDNQSFSIAPPMPSQPDYLDNDPYGGMEELPPDGGAGGTMFNEYGSPEFNESAFTEPLRVTDRSSDRQEHFADEGIRRRGATDATANEEWDLTQLGDEKLDLQAYVKKVLTGADEEEKKRLKAALLRERQSNKKELQRLVFKHYAEFVTISKEISTLENDMLELRELLGQWKDLPQLMGMEDTLAPTLDKNGNLERKRTQRNSVLDLQNLYRTQLTQLWSIVEGSQKYLPVVPGRHLVFESHNVIELNAATYKPKQSCSMFLLSDVLLIAGKRRMKGGGGAEVGTQDKEKERGRLVAERCWNLSELVIVDVKDGGDLVNVIKVQRGKEYCVYKTNKSDEKRAILSAFKQISRELNEKKRKDNEKEQERRKTMWLGGNDKGGDSLSVMGTPGRALSTIGLSMTDSKDLRWIDEFGDDLTMAVATRDWEKALALVEKGQALAKTIESDPSAHALITTRLDQLLPTFVSSLCHDLSSPSLRKTASARLISLLIQLDRSELARDTFLKARREIMMRRVRSIKCEGDISSYINELAVVCFTIVRHTSDWYMNAFKESRMASGFVTWAKEQIETFVDLFRRQVDVPDVDQSVVDECLHVTASQNRKLLRDVGLDFTFLLISLLQPSAGAQTYFAITSPHPSSTPVSGRSRDQTFSAYSALSDSTSRPSIARDRSNSGYATSPTKIRERSTSGASRMARERSGSSVQQSVPPLNLGRSLPPAGSGANGNGMGMDNGRQTASAQGSPSLPPRSERRAKAVPKTNMEGFL